MKGGICVKKFILLFILVLILSGCTNADGNDYNFSGNSENWEVIYTIEVSNDNEQVYRGEAHFIGEGEAPESIDYELVMNSSSSGGTNARLIDGVAKVATGSCGGGCESIEGDEEIEVEITWDGQTENLILTTDK